MFIIEADNVNQAYYLGLKLMNERGQLAKSRNGAVRKMPAPVMTRYKYSQERVLFDKMRDCNPYLHMFESVWMLEGRNDVKWLEQFTSKGRFAQFSDDGETLHGAYGYRWRKHFNEDQLSSAIFDLYTDHTTRRVVINMWDPYIDGPIARLGGKDVPCNTQILFNVRPNGELDMTVVNRSNDMIWGAYGANVVHMSILHEYIARSAALDMGYYYQMSNDFHMYERHFNLLTEVEFEDPYTSEEIQPRPLFAKFDQRGAFDKDVKDFVDDPYRVAAYRTEFFTQTITPMANSYKMYKAKYVESAKKLAEQIESTDWRRACLEWLERRVK